MGQSQPFIQALRGEPVSRVPVWFMRQAGRYLPEYRQLRAQSKGFLDFCHHPQWVVEATLQPIDRFDLDAAIIFADILLLPHAMGMDLDFVAGEGPRFARPVRTREDVARLTPFEHGRFDFLWESIVQTQAALQQRVPLIGFAGTPWTVACYMVEGRGRQGFRAMRARVHQDPDGVHALLAKLTEATVAYLQAQIDAGVDVIMLFDSWAALLNPQDYRAFSLQYIERIFDALRAHARNVPTILFAKGVDPYLEALATSGVDALGLDWTSSLPEVRTRLARVGAACALQGNMDPAVLFGSPDTVRAEVQRIIASNQGAPGYVFNLGHGIDRDTPIASVEAMVAAVREYGQTAS